MDATAVRSILLRLALVVAVLAGLLAMHTVITGPQHSAAAAAVTVEHHAADTGGALTESAIPDDCGSDCPPLHTMGVMVCLLALLVAWVLSGAAPPAGRWMRASPVATLALVSTLRSVAPPPPSLVALSISRT